MRGMVTSLAGGVVMIAVHIGRTTMRRVLGSRIQLAPRDYELLTGRAARAYVESETRRRVGLSVEEFRSRLGSGEMPDTSDVAYLSVLTGGASR
jgi:hypothetical protein